MDYDYSALGRLKPTGSRTPWLVRYVTLPIIFAGLFAAVVINGQIGNNSDGGPTIWSILANDLMLISYVAAILVPLIYLFYKFFENRQRNKAITMFGLVNGLKALSEAEAYAELPAALTQISAGVTTNAYTFKSGNNSMMDVFEYKYSLRHHNKDTDYYSTIAVFNTKNTLPHVFLDSKKDGLLYAYSSSQKVNLEGDFSKYYNVYSPEMANIELRQIFTPDVMQALIAIDAQYDLELSGNRGALIAPGYIYSRDKLPEFLAFAESLRKDVDNESVDWDVIMDIIGSKTSGSTATQLRRNTLWRNISIGSVALMIIIYVIMIFLASS